MSFNILFCFQALILCFSVLFRYAKALHYKEEEFHRDRNPNVFESLILVNNKLQQKEATEGLLVMAHRNVTEELQVSGFWKIKCVILMATNTSYFLV